jgi:hypothetical protein
MREHIMGVAVSEIASEMRMVTERTTANSRKSRPMIPPISRIGVNTATREMLMDSTVDPISSAPLKAASIGFMPCPRYAG